MTFEDHVLLSTYQKYFKKKRLLPPNISRLTLDPCSRHLLMTPVTSMTSVIKTCDRDLTWSAKRTRPRLPAHPARSKHVVCSKSADRFQTQRAVSRCLKNLQCFREIYHESLLKHLSRISMDIYISMDTYGYLWISAIYGFRVDGSPGLLSVAMYGTVFSSAARGRLNWASNASWQKENS